MYGKLFLLLLLGMCGASSLRAQGNVMKSLFKTSSAVEASARQAGKQVARMASKHSAAKLAVVPSLAVGAEALRVQVSPVGLGKYRQNVRNYNLVSKVVPVQVPENRWLQKPLDGYISSFKTIHFDAAEQESKLLAIYGKDKHFQGVFVGFFEDLRQHSYGPVKKPETLASALKTALEQGEKKRAGFLALLVDGNAFRPKDILIWNNTSNTWISYNKSKAEVLRHNYKERLARVEEENKYWAGLLQEQGLVVRPDNYDSPKSIRVSQDMVTWQELPLDSQAGQEIWDAWNEGLYITYERHSHTARFAENKDALVSYSSLEHLFYARAAVDAGFVMQEKPSGEIVFAMDGKNFPNLFVYGNDGKLEAVKYEPFTVGASFPEHPVSFLKDLREISQTVYASDSARRIIFLKDVAEKGAFYDAEDCVKYLSRDGHLSLPDLEELKSVENGL